MKKNKLLPWLWFLWGLYLLLLEAKHLLAPALSIYPFSGFWVAYSFAAFINVFGIYHKRDWARPLTTILSVLLVINIIFTLHYLLLLGRITHWTQAAQVAAFLLKIIVPVYSLKIVFWNDRRTA